jgi:CheY-like chemotaxis protein
LVRTPRNILLVEDEPTLQRILGSVLTDAGHRVESVGTAEQAVERLENAGNADIDLVLSDKNLPAMNGLELLERLRAHERKLRRNIGFVLVTGYPSRDSALAVLAADGDGYLVKPFRSLSHAVEQIQSILDANLSVRRAGTPDARRIAQIISGIPGAEFPGSSHGSSPSTVAGNVSAAVLLDDAGVAAKVRTALGRAGVKVDDVPKLPPNGRVALVAGRVEDLHAFARGRLGASLVLADGGASFNDVVTLIASGGGAVCDPGLS